MHPVRPWHAGRVLSDVRSRATPTHRVLSFRKSLGGIWKGWGAVSIAADVLVFVVGLTLSFNLPVIGELPVAELLLLFSLPFLLVVKGKRLNQPGIKPIYILMLLWLGSQGIADLYRQTPFVDWTRGEATIIFFAIDLAFFVVILSQNPRRKLGFMVGFAIGSLLAARFAPVGLAEDDPWKFGYATGVNLLAVLAGSYFIDKRRYLLCTLALVGMVGINLLANFRSPVLLLLVAAPFTLPLIPERIGRLRLLPRAGSLSRVAVLVVLALGAAAIAIGLVRFATASGFIGEDAQAKNESQLQGGFLLAGRPEIVVSSQAVLEHPFIGWGSFGRSYKYVEMLSDFQARYGFQTDLTDTEENLQGLIPAHSHIMGAWVWAGVLGAVFWVYIFRLAGKALLRLSLLKPPLALFYAFLLVSFLWDILFSPFQAFRRATDSFVLVVILDLLTREDFGIRFFAPLSRSGWTRLSPSARQAMIERHRETKSGHASGLQAD